MCLPCVSMYVQYSTSLLLYLWWSRGVIEVWHTLIATTEKMACGRQKVADDMLDKISEESKQHRKEKEAAFKRVSD